MENEHRSEFGTQSTKSETKADKEWSEFERDLESLGRQLAELQIGRRGVQWQPVPRGCIRAQHPNAAPVRDDHDVLSP